MQTEVFTELDIIPSEPPRRFTKPWFARGWVIGGLLATIATAAVLVSFVAASIPTAFLVMVGLLWLMVLLKYLKGVRYLEIYADAVLVYALNPVKPVAQIPFERMTVVQDVDEIYFIPKKKFTGGFSLKKVYWKHDWEAICTLFNNKAAYVRRNDPKNRGGFDTPLPIPTTAGSRHRSGFGVISAAIIIYEWFIGLLLFVPYRMAPQKPNNNNPNFFLQE